MEKQVNVLMSAYNGDRYVKEQIDSILAQTYENVKIYVRDDGSTDNTLKILEEYANAGKITLIRGENLGYGKSFMKLLQAADEGEYWAFSDQDDVWAEDKISRAVSALETIAQHIPGMYYHSYYLTDENLDIIGKSSPVKRDFSFQKALTECVHLGFATVINKSMRAYMLEGLNTDIVSHDWWAELIVMAFGQLYEDHGYYGAKHRRLNDSISNMGLLNRFRWLFRSFRRETEIHNLTRNFYAVFKDQMKEDDRQLLMWFASQKYSIRYAVKKAFYHKRWRSSIASECVVRMLMLFGRL